MNTINVQASVNNLTQVDRLSADQHRTPMVNQEQNSTLARETLARRAEAPVQPDATEGKNIDPNAHRREQNKSKKRGRNSTKNKPDPDPPSHTGYFVDLSA